MQVETLFTAVANTYLVLGEHGIVVIDPGMPYQAHRIVNRIRALGVSERDVRLILVTHGHIDHAGSAAALKRLTGAPIAIHPADAPLVATPDLKIPPGRGRSIDAAGRFIARFGWVMPLETFQPDIPLEDGQWLDHFGLDARVIHTPGHTPGSVTLAFQDGTFFCGDAILNLIRVSFPLFWQDKEDAGASACKIRSLGPRLIYSGHGRPFDSHQLDAFVGPHCS